MIFDELIAKADQGMAGRNAGLPMGLPTLGKAINHIQRGRYDVIAGKTSAGKTAFVDQCYVMEPFKYYMEHKDTLGIKLDWLYFSLEIAPVKKFTKLAARALWDQHKIETSLSELLSLGDNKLSPSKREKLGELRGFFDEFEKCMHIYDAYDTSLEISNKIYDFYKANGTFTKVKGRTIYTPNHSNHYVIIVIDTVNLLGTTERGNLKSAIDDLSKKMIWYRNVCEASPVICHQYNAEISNPMRIAQKRMEPQSDDLEDSKRTSKDCDTYISVFDPSELGLRKSPGGYDLEKLKNKFRQIKIHKNRDGDRDIRFGSKFMGHIGMFEELKPSALMTPADYELALTLTV